MSQKQILSVINETVEVGIRLLVFSGGECFLLGKDLETAISYATQLNLMTRCVTNGYWANSKESAKKRLKKLQNSGLTEINFSTGDNHQKFIHVKNIINGCLAALSLGMRVAVMVELHKNPKFTKNNLILDPDLERVLEDPEKRDLFHIVESPWMPNNLDSIVEQKDNILVNKPNVSSRERCTSILTTFAIDPYGNISCCCGLTRHNIPEMTIGTTKTHSLSDCIKSAFNDFLKIWLYTEGPEKILAWAANKDPSIKWENLYAHTCHSCLAIYHNNKVKRIIRKYHKEKIADVLFRYYMLTEMKIPDDRKPDKEVLQFG